MMINNNRCDRTVKRARVVIIIVNMYTQSVRLRRFPTRVMTPDGGCMHVQCSKCVVFIASSYETLKRARDFIIGSPPPRS